MQGLFAKSYLVEFRNYLWKKWFSNEFDGIMFTCFFPREQI